VVETTTDAAVTDGGPPAGRRFVGDRRAGGYPAGTVTGETFERWKEQVEGNPEKILVTYHGYFPDGAPEGAGYLHFVDDEPDASRFESSLAEHPGAIDLWLGGHTHARPGDRFGDKSHVEREWGVTFVNVAPMTRLLQLGPGSALADLHCYLPTDDVAPVGSSPNRPRRFIQTTITEGVTTSEKR
jgi:hypothetical protein